MIPNSPVNPQIKRRFQSVTGFFARAKIIEIAVLSAIYFLAAKFGFSLAFVHPSATPIWPPTGIVLAALILFGYRLWPAIFIGAFLANVTTAGSAVTSAGIAIGNTLEGVVGAYLVNRFAGSVDVFKRPKDIFAFALFAGAASPAISATFGVTSLFLGGYADGSDYGSIWLTWLLGNSGGNLLLAPVLILWGTKPRMQWDRNQAWEISLLLLLLLAVSQAVFGDLLPFADPLFFLCIPPLIWAGARFGQREAATAVLLISGFAIRGTLLGFGPLVSDTPNKSLLFLDAFTSVISLMSLALAASVAEHVQAREEVLKSKNQLEGSLVERTVELLERKAQLGAATKELIDQISERERAEESSRKNLARIQALREIGVAISSTLEVRAILDILFSKIDLLVPYSVVTVRLLNPQTGELEPMACFNMDEAAWKKENPPGMRSLGRLVFHTRSPLVVADLQNDNRVEEFEFIRRNGLISYLGLPLVAKQEALGVVSFVTRTEHKFDQQEVDFLAAAASHVAMIIYNAQLFERTKKLAIDFENANQVKDEFLKLMSHELRTPLQVIIGYTAMIRDQFFGQTSSGQEEALSKITKSTYELFASISSILEVARIEAGGVKVENSELDLVEFLDTLKLSYTSRPDKEVSLLWIYPSVLPVLRTDSEKLRQILQQLLENAIRFTEKGSVAVTVCWLPDAHAVEFKVMDTGAGISNDLLPSIFDRFRQIENFETRSHSGMGLGLYFVKVLTEMLGGKIEVESRVGRGSTFTLTLPCEWERLKIARRNKRVA